jgi:2-amino-4-hydroxy-6-hydroxymethyldihydropteridine diphosphokinase
MLGSNSDAERNIELANEKLSEYFEVVSVSSMHINKPVGKHYKNDFWNLAMKIFSPDTAVETKAILKQIEIEMGRTPECKIKGLIPIDIDMVCWNDSVITEDYERFDFVKTCVDEIL